VSGTRTTSPGHQHATGGRSGKAGYLARRREYREQFASIDRPGFDESSSPTATAWSSPHRQPAASGGHRQADGVMAIWTVADGKVTALREADAPAGLAGFAVAALTQRERREIVR
jgi:hypothetical protein